MDKKNYNNSLCDQIISLSSIADEQVNECFDSKKLLGLMSIAEIFDARKVILIGCGDSYSAAGGVASAFKDLTGVFECSAPTAIEFTRFMTEQDIGIGEPHSPLVIAISSGGRTSRVEEAILKANDIGAMTLLLTNNEHSPCARAAKKVFALNTPNLKGMTPGLHSYFASVVGLFALAARMGHVRNVLGPQSELDMKEAILSYVHSFDTVVSKIDNQMFELANQWKDLINYDFIGCGAQLFSALFSAQKFYETNGLVCNVDDAEDWCHIDYHLKKPETIGTVIFADKNRNAFSRIQETVSASAGIGRPTLVITNGKKEDFDERAEVVIIPETPTGYTFLSPLMEYIPAGLLAGYCASLNRRDGFNLADLGDKGIAMEKDPNKIYSSEIVIYK